MGEHLMRHLDYGTVEPGSIAQFPGNPRVGDVDAIMESLVAFGQYRTLVVREGEGDRPRMILAGNHTDQAAQKLAALTGEEFTTRYGPDATRPGPLVRIDLVECDDHEAMRINAADNRLAELGEYNDRALAELLQAMGDDYFGTGFDAEFAQDLFKTTDLLGDAASAFLTGQGDPDAAGNGNHPPPPDAAGGEFVLVSWLVSPADREVIREAVAAAQAAHTAPTAALALVEVARAYLEASNQGAPS